MEPVTDLAEYPTGWSPDLTIDSQMFLSQLGLGRVQAQYLVLAYQEHSQDADSLSGPLLGIWDSGVQLP